MGSNRISEHKKEKHPSRVSNILCTPQNSREVWLTSSSSIVAIHGLGSKADTAWLGSVSKANWLADFLPVTHRNFRIIAVNHNSRWDAYSPVQSLRDYGQVILDSIAALLLDEEVRLMLLIDSWKLTKSMNRRSFDLWYWLAIRLGGFWSRRLWSSRKVCANRLTSCSNAQDVKQCTESDSDTRERSVADASIGTLFFGTPHKGYANVKTDPLPCVPYSMRPNSRNSARILPFSACYPPTLATGQDLERIFWSS